MCVCVCVYPRKKGAGEDHSTREGQSELLEKPLVSDQEEPGEGRKGQGPAEQEWTAENEKETRKPLS